MPLTCGRTEGITVATVRPGSSVVICSGFPFLVTTQLLASAGRLAGPVCRHILLALLKAA